MKYFNHFSPEELFSNCSDAEILSCIKSGALNNVLRLFFLLDEIRDYCGQPFVITSTYRDKEHNERVGGSVTSQHLYGAAVDFFCPKVPFETLVYLVQDAIKKAGLQYALGQVIFYYKRQFIHVALPCSKHSKLTIYYYEKGNN